MSSPKKIKLVLLLISLFSIISLEKAYASYNFYVDPSFSGSENGSEGAPFNSLTEALNASYQNPEGERKIFLKSGNYSEDVTLFESVELFASEDTAFFLGKIFMKNKTVLNGVNLKGDRAVITIEGEADVTLEKIEIDEPKKDCITALAGGGKLTLKNSVIKKGSKGIYIERGREIEITNNKIYENREEGMDIREAVRGTIWGNSILSNGESGIEFIVGKTDLNISENTIERNQASAIVAQFYKSAPWKGKIFITKNSLSHSRKYGLDCGNPSGGKYKLSYFKKSIKYKKNSFRKNKKKPVNFCLK